MVQQDWESYIKRKSFPTYTITIIIITVFVAVITILLITQLNKPSNLNLVPVSYTEEISYTSKGFVDSEFRDASDQNQIYISGYRVELNNNWKHIKNVTSLKDTPFVSNKVEIDSTTYSDGNTAKVFYISNGSYTFYISNQLITETNYFDQDGSVYSQVVNPAFNQDGIYLTYTVASILTNNGDEFLLKKQFFTCPNTLKDFCIASGYLPFTQLENQQAENAFMDFLNSIKIYEQK